MRNLLKMNLLEDLTFPPAFVYNYAATIHSEKKNSAIFSNLCYHFLPLVYSLKGTILNTAVETFF